MDVLKRIISALGFELAGDMKVKPGIVAALRKLAGSGKRPWWLDYGLPLITTTVALLVIEAAGPESAVNAPVIVFMFPIILSAYVGGLKPGLFATVIATLAAVYFVLPPTHSWGVESPADNVKWIVLCGAGALVSFLMAHREELGQKKTAPEVGGLLLFTKRRVYAGFATLLACLIAIAAVSYPALERFRKDAGWVDRTHQIVASLRLVISSVTDAESGERGYIITGNRDFLEPYQSAQQRVNRALAELRSLTRDDPAQQRRLDWLDPLVAERFVYFKAAIESRDRAFASAQALVSSGSGKRLHDLIRAQVAEMETAEQALLAEREAREKRASRVVKTLVLGGSALAVLIAAAALWMIGKAFQASRDAEWALQESHHELELRVKERTAELVEERDRLAALVNSINDEVWFADTEKKFTLVNPKGLHEFGRMSGDGPGVETLARSLEVYRPDGSVRPVEEAPPLRALTGEVVTDQEEIVRNSTTGELRHRQVSAAPVRDTAGNIIGSVSVVRDVTERKRAEEALRRRAEELETVMRVAPVAIFVADDPGCHNITGNHLANLFYEAGEGENVSAGPAPGKPDSPRRFFREGRELAAEELPMQEAAARSADVKGAEFDVLLPSGKSVNLYGSASPLRDAEGKVRGCVGAFLDITKRKQAEEALVLRARELARTNAELAQFAYVASHDLKEPLRAVSGGVRLLEKTYQGKLDDFAHECIAHAIDGCLRMESLIDGLLAYSRVGTAGEEFESVDSARVLHAALQNLDAGIRESGAVVTSDALPPVHGDAPLLLSLFQNLISNAVKFRGDLPPRIHVSAESHGNYWNFSIRDNGIGIDPQFFGKIFRVFQRLHTRRAYPGTGIGLALCKKIVESHGGRIWVESRPGEGTTFYFSLLDAQGNYQQKREIHAQRRDAA